MPLAKVTLTITTFTAGGCCAISKPVIEKTGGNRLKYADAADPANFTLVAVGKNGDALDIAFTIPGYTPTSIVFTPTNTGAQNFINATISGNTITVTNTFKNTGKGPAAPTWEYAIGVTNAQGVAGQIDPQVRNDLDD
jgi:hypothetical protein